MATKVIKTTFKLRRGNAAEWAQYNPTLARGEPGFEVDTNKLKIGNGVDAYNDLDYINGGTDASVIEAATAQDFPVIGDIEKLYKATQEKALYQWNGSSYEKLSSTDINGGSAQEPNGQIILRNDNTAAWGQSGAVLAKGEVVVEFLENNTPVLRVGDGITSFDDLPMITSTGIATDEIVGIVKGSQEIGVENDGSLYLKKVSTDKLVQGDLELVLDGGNTN